MLSSSGFRLGPSALLTVNNGDSLSLTNAKQNENETESHVQHLNAAESEELLGLDKQPIHFKPPGGPASWQAVGSNTASFSLSESSGQSAVSSFVGGGVHSALSSSVLVRVSGPDPHRRKMRNSSFFINKDGNTTLTASGFVVIAPVSNSSNNSPSSFSNNKVKCGCLAVCSASLISPFLSSSHSHQRISSSFSSAAARSSLDVSPRLIDGAAVDIRLESPSESTANPGHLHPSTALGAFPNQWKWFRCSLVAVGEMSEVSAAIRQLTQSSADWKVGWNKPPQMQSNGNGSASSKTAAYPAFSDGEDCGASCLALLLVQQPLPDEVASIPISSYSSSCQIHPLGSNDVLQWQSTLSHVVASSASLSPSPSSLATWSTFMCPPSLPLFSPLRWASAVTLQRGSSLFLLAAPYGALSPAVFTNSVSRGILSNVVFQPVRSLSTLEKENKAVLFLSDVRALPGCEGGAVVDADGRLVGMLAVPIRHTNASSQVELQIVLSSDVIALFLRRVFQSLPNSFNSNSTSLLSSLPLSSAKRAVFGSQPANEQNMTSAWVHSHQRQIHSGRTAAQQQQVQQRRPVAEHNQNPQKTIFVTAPQLSRKVPVLSNANAIPLAESSDHSPEEADDSDDEHSGEYDDDAGWWNDAAEKNRFLLLEEDGLRVRAVNIASRSLLIIRISNSWASAFVIHQNGFIVTNAHLLRPFLHSPQRFSSQSSSSRQYGNIRLTHNVHVHLEDRHFQAKVPTNATGWQRCSVVYLSSGPWDLALLKLDQHVQPLCPIPLAEIKISEHQSSSSKVLTLGQNIVRGAPVVAVGHPLFSPASALHPSATHGVLANVVYLNCPLPHRVDTKVSGMIPVLLQSDAAIHNGNSGGLLMDVRTGKCLGVVTSNVMHAHVDPNSHLMATLEPESAVQGEADDVPSTSASSLSPPKKDIIASRIIPHLNFSIPSCILLPLHVAALHWSSDRNSAESALSFLDSFDESNEVARLWALALTVAHDKEDPEERESRYGPKYRKFIQQLQEQQQETSKHPGAHSSTLSSTASSAAASRSVSSIASTLSRASANTRISRQTAAIRAHL